MDSNDLLVKYLYVIHKNNVESGTIELFFIILYLGKTNGWKAHFTEKQSKELEDVYYAALANIPELKDRIQFV